MEQERKIDVMIAEACHEEYVDIILDTIEAAAKVRGTGIAKRTHEYVAQKMKEGKAVIALEPLKEQWHPYSPVLSFFFPHHGCLNILINAIFIKRRQFSVAQFELFAFYYPLNVVIHIFPDAVNYFKVLTCMFLF